MDLKHAFHLSVYGSAALAAFMLATAEGSGLPALTVFFAIIALILLERKRVPGCPAIISNVLGLIAFGIATSEFLEGDIESRLLAGAHLLVYLQWIVLFQKKTRRQYWAICALALLQAAVGSVLTDQSWYGFLLVALLLLQVWTLTIFSLLEARQKFESSLNVVPPSVEPNDRGFSHLFNASSFAPDAIQIDPGEPWVNRRLVTTVFGFVFFSLLISSAVFAFTPRLWLPAEISDGDSIRKNAVRAITGFSNEVQLGDLGKISKSNDRVMTVRLFDNDTKQPLDPMEFAASVGWDEPYFRGSSLQQYRDGRWRRIPRSFGQVDVKKTTTNSTSGLVRQEFELENTGTRYLFMMHPFHSISVETDRSKDSGAACRRVETNIVRPIYGRGTKAWPLRYQVLSSGPETTQPPFNAWANVVSPTELRVAEYFYKGLPSSGLERLKKLATDVALPDSDTEPPDSKTQAERLVAHLSGGTYAYTLDASITDETIDPVEDFLFNRKKGHCDYYATSLTLMLRSIDIPARFVNGFKGGYENSVSGQFEVQQRHSHAWVEAFYDGRWNPLDATPSSARSESVDQYDPQFRVLNDVGASIGNLWERYVVDVSLEGQQQSIYAPLATAFKEWLPSSEDMEFDKLIALAIDPERWISWQGGVVTFVLMLGATIVYRLHPLRRLIALLRRKGIGFKRRERKKQIVVAFYERFHKLCVGQNLIRSAAQTHREFSAQVTDKLRPNLEAFGLLSVPDEVTQFFYNVRFGQHELTQQQLDKIDSQIKSLENCFDSASSHPQSSS